MNAYELADKLNEYDKDGLPVLVVGQAVEMLRQQADRIAELESRKAWFEVNKEGYVQHKELSDEEIWKIYNITGLGNGMAVRFARAIIKASRGEE